MSKNYFEFVLTWKKTANLFFSVSKKRFSMKRKNEAFLFFFSRSIQILEMKKSMHFNS